MNCQSLLRARIDNLKLRLYLSEFVDSGLSGQRCQSRKELPDVFFTPTFQQFSVSTIILFSYLLKSILNFLLYFFHHCNIFLQHKSSQKSESSNAPFFQISPGYFDLASRSRSHANKTLTKNLEVEILGGEAPTYLFFYWIVRLRYSSKNLLFRLTTFHKLTSFQICQKAYKSNHCCVLLEPIGENYQMKYILGFFNTSKKIVLQIL